MYGTWAWFFKVKLEEVPRPLSEYEHLTAFFTRRLREGCRPIHPSALLVSPVDGRVVSVSAHVGTDGTLAQVKNIAYHITDFLGIPVPKVKPGHALYSAVLYLSPGDYHRFHSPTEWTAASRTHFAGQLLPVNPLVASILPSLFVANERVALLGSWAHGFFSYTAVGATNVGSIRISFDDELTTNTWVHDWRCGFNALEAVGLTPVPPAKPGTVHGREYKPAVSLARGDDVGLFELGSTVVLIFEAPASFEWGIAPGDPVAVGMPLGGIKDATSNKGVAEEMMDSAAALQQALHELEGDASEGNSSKGGASGSSSSSSASKKLSAGPRLSGSFGGSSSSPSGGGKSSKQPQQQLGLSLDGEGNSGGSEGDDEIGGTEEEGYEEEEEDDDDVIRVVTSGGSSGLRSLSLSTASGTEEEGEEEGCSSSGEVDLRGLTSGDDVTAAHYADYSSGSVSAGSASSSSSSAKAKAAAAKKGRAAGGAGASSSSSSSSHAQYHHHHDQAAEAAALGLLLHRVPGAVRDALHQQQRSAAAGTGDGAAGGGEGCPWCNCGGHGAAASSSSRGSHRKELLAPPSPSLLLTPGRQLPSSVFAAAFPFPQQQHRVGGGLDAFPLGGGRPRALSAGAVVISSPSPAKQGDRPPRHLAGAAASSAAGAAAGGGGDRLRSETAGSSTDVEDFASCASLDALEQMERQAELASARA